MRKSIANNHLSELAQEGRYGDTEVTLSKYVAPGKLWHVNPQEKSLMERGAGGERLVDAMGSGTFNPKTGLEEKFDPITIGLAVAGVAIGASSAFKGGKAQHTQARYEEQASQEGLRQLEGAEQQLDQAAGAKRLFAQQEYGMGVEELSAETGMAQQDIHQQTQQALQQSGMATQGTVQQKQSDMWKRVQGAFGRGKKGLLANLGKKMGDIEGWYEGEKARITNERAKFKRQGDFASDKQDAWYLGKNLFGGHGGQGV
jgi:hypothetical protein